EAKLATAIAQLVKESCRLSDGDMKDNARVLTRQAVDDGEDNPLGNARASGQSHLTRPTIGEKADIFHTLFDLIEGSNPALDERAAIFSRLDTLRAALEQGHAKRMFYIGNSA